MKIIIDSNERRQYAADQVMKIMKEDNQEVIIRDHVEDKTAEQRAFFHVLCRLLCKDTGYTEGEIKQLIKAKVLGTKIVEFAGIRAEVIASSEYDDEGKKRSKPSYSQLIAGAYQVGADAEIQLPNPTYRE